MTNQTQLGHQWARAGFNRYICECISPADQFSKRCTADCTPQCLVEESKKTMCPGKKKKGEEMASEVVEGLDGG